MVFFTNRQLSRLLAQLSKNGYILTKLPNTAAKAISVQATKHNRNTSETIIRPPDFFIELTLFFITP